MKQKINFSFLGKQIEGSYEGTPKHWIFKSESSTFKEYFPNGILASFTCSFLPPSDYELLIFSLIHAEVEKSRVHQELFFDLTCVNGSKYFLQYFNQLLNVVKIQSKNGEIKEGHSGTCLLDYNETMSEFDFNWIGDSNRVAYDIYSLKPDINKVLSTWIGNK
jgi:hypothetical protein